MTGDAGDRAGRLDAGLLRDLADVVGPAHVLTDPELTAAYCTDWTRRFCGASPLVVRPADTTQTAAVLRLLSGASLSVVPQGGNTGLVGGSVPLGGEAVLSLRRLDRCEPVDRLSGQATFGAGVTLAAAQAHAAAAGLSVGVSLAARDSATIGGMVATNAGGVHVLRYGAMRAQVVGIEAALADGTVLSHLAGLTKDNTGYDLGSLLAGSEGTLAVMTRVRLRLWPQLVYRTTALLAFASTAAAVEAAALLRRRIGSLHALEAVFATAMQRVCEHLGTQPPVGSLAAGDDVPARESPHRDSPAGAATWLLVEAADRSDPTAELSDAVESLDDLLVDAAVAFEPDSARRLWALRENLTDAIAAAGIAHKLDVTLPTATLGRFVDTVDAAVRSADPSAKTLLFGHLGDGNIHVNVLGPDGAPPDDAVDDAVLRLVASLGGSISAEHGIGTAKLAHLHLNRSEAELRVFRAIKTALDPDAVLNPNVLVPRP